MRKTTFKGTALPLLLLTPQLLVTFVFFLWPAGAAIWQSVLQEDPWGLSSEFVGLRNFIECWPSRNGATRPGTRWSSPPRSRRWRWAWRCSWRCRRTSRSAAPMPTGPC